MTGIAIMHEDKLAQWLGTIGKICTILQTEDLLSFFNNG